MPEIPDIEVFARNIHKLVRDKTLLKIRIVNGEKLPHKATEYSRKLKGKKIRRVYRSGKEMRFAFEDGTIMGLHLMLTGDIIPFEKKNTHHSTIAELYFEDDTGFALTDRMKNAHITINPIDKTGIDALSPKMNFEYLKKALQRKRNIKSILTDQNIIRGIGNSYSDEILWEVRIAPHSTGRAIPDKKIKELLFAMKQILKQAIKKIAKHQKGKVNGEVKDYLKIHTKVHKKSPTGFPIIIEKKGIMKTYWTKEQVVYE